MMLYKSKSHGFDVGIQNGGDQTTLNASGQFNLAYQGPNSVLFITCINPSYLLILGFLSPKTILCSATCCSQALNRWFPPVQRYGFDGVWRISDSMVFRNLNH